MAQAGACAVNSCREHSRLMKAPDELPPIRLPEDVLRDLVALLGRPGLSISAIARQARVARNTVYRARRWLESRKAKAQAEQVA